MSLYLFAVVVVAAVYCSVCTLRGLLFNLDPGDRASWMLWRRDGWRRRRTE